MSVGISEIPELTEKQFLNFRYKVIDGDDSECWIWHGARARKGYGNVNINKRGVVAHRLAFKLSTGIDPIGFEVGHTCDNPPCVNPAHLFLATPQQNTDDKLKKGRQSSNVGEENPNRKLDENDVRLIRERCSKGERFDLLCVEFGVTKAAIRHLVTRRTWKHVE